MAVRRFTVRLACAVALLGAPGAAVVSAASAPDDGFTAFWTGFRAAALRGDMAALAAGTRFPLQAGFDSDQDHPRPITRAQFAGYFRTELGCPGGRAGTNLDEIRRNVQLQPPYNFHAGARAVVGSFEFARSAGQWRFTTINYGDPSEHEAVLKGHCLR